MPQKNIFLVENQEDKFFQAGFVGIQFNQARLVFCVIVKFMVLARLVV
jgi:hypothetical protein